MGWCLPVIGRAVKSRIWRLWKIPCNLGNKLPLQHAQELITDGILRSHKPFTVLQQFRPKFQPAHMLGLNTVAIEAGRVKRKF